MPHFVTGSVELPLTVASADVDGDGDIDIIAAMERRIVWHANTDGDGTFGPQNIITTDEQTVLPVSIHAADLDDDGDLDVLSASFRPGGGDVPDGGRIAWYENLDGAGTFGLQQLISIAVPGAYSVFTADLDEDGDQDVLSANFRHRDPKIAWYENLDGAGTFGPQRRINRSNVNGARAVRAADLDGDGDMDVLYASAPKNKIAWFENTDGAGRFAPERIVTTSATFVLSIDTADVDSDGDIDILSASHDDDKIAWYENTDGVGMFSPAQVITTDAIRAAGVAATDLDGDGDLDVISGSRGDNLVAWYENTDGAGHFGSRQILASSSEIFPADIDGDGDVDVVAGHWGEGVFWYENRIPGDANDDGAFNSADLMLVIAAGEYEDTLLGNSTFEEGDWNGDGDFDSSDLVAAFQAGTYSTAANPDGSRLVVDSLFADDLFLRQSG